MSRNTRAVPIHLVVLLTVLLSPAWFLTARPVSAQATPIDCSAVPTPRAASAATPTTPASPEAIAFPEGGGDLTVFAAASLTDSFEAIKTTLELDNPGLTITYNFAGSQALVTQLTEGAEADVFASASTSQMTAAIDNDVIDGAPVVFVRNTLVLIVPADNPGQLASYSDLGKDDLKLVLALPDVPAGQYARQSICQAATDVATYGETFLEDVQRNIVSEENNIRAVATKVSLGEADAGIVYATDVTDHVRDQLHVIEIPANVNVVASYPIAPVAGGDTVLADAFIAFLTGPDGQAILQRYGFEPKL